MPGPDGITFRPLSSEEDYLACIELQTEDLGPRLLGRGPDEHPQDHPEGGRDRGRGVRARRPHPRLRLWAGRGARRADLPLVPHAGGGPRGARPRARHAPQALSARAAPAPGRRAGGVDLRPPGGAQRPSEPEPPRRRARRVRARHVRGGVRERARQGDRDRPLHRGLADRERPGGAPPGRGAAGPGGGPPPLPGRARRQPRRGGAAARRASGRRRDPRQHPGSEGGGSGPRPRLPRLDPAGVRALPGRRLADRGFLPRRRALLLRSYPRE